MRDKLRIVLRFGAKFAEALLAQWLERAAVNRKVTGSIPVGSVFAGIRDNILQESVIIQELNRISGWHCVRVVKESDLNSDGLCPHRFEPCRCRFWYFAKAALISAQPR